jgi:hypothetical protein
MKRFLFTIIILLWAASAHAAIWYVDNTATGSNNGTSWANAWTALPLSSNSSVQAGDTVYISGGSVGQTYSGNWIPKHGSAGNPITYTIGVDAGHNGPVTMTSIGSMGDTMVGVTVAGNSNSHIILSASSGNSISSNAGASYCTFNYIDLQGIIYMNNSSHMNFGWITAHFYNNVDSAIYGVGNSGSGYGDSSFHDSSLYLQYKGAGIGDDGFKWVGHMDIYNCNIIGVRNSGYSGNQHQDGIQTSVSYMRLYNNYWENMQNYPIYGDIYGTSSMSNWIVYNNVINQWDTTGSQGISIGCDGQVCNGTNFYIANNTIVNSASCIQVDQGTQGGSWSGTTVVNNLCYNAGTILTSNSGAVVSNNTTATTNVNFVNYGATMSYPTLDLHLLSSSTAVIDKGISEASTFTTDKDGVSRPQGSAWDIGAYEFVSGGSTVKKPMPPTSLTIN